jgi:hypothetical protein
LSPTACGTILGLLERSKEGFLRCLTQE